MTPNRTNLAREVFDDALEQEPELRQKFLEERCHGDQALRDEVASLLVAYDEAQSFLEPPVKSDTAPRADASAESQPLPTIHGYRIRRVLGKGGMGIVFEAEQEQPRRSVALKVVRGGRFVDQHVLRLFEREAQTLARLRHPSIAAVYEVGRTEDGQQFFAMELVPGVPLDEYIKDTHSNTEAKLKLFRRVCEAIQHAHHHGVIHRDLKPSNILIDAEGNPKVLDFGLAKITDADVALTVSTAVGKIQGTLAYMSPEQARGEPHDIGLLSDVYALGVILYELATGQSPYDTRGRTLPEAVRMICEQPPQRLSTIGQTCPAELLTIALKALEKEPARRYQSAAVLAEDIERFLKSQPILARPPSTVYQFRKLVARHRLLSALLLGLFLTLTVSSIWLAVLYRTADRSHRLAREQASRATQTQSFLESMLSSVDPNIARGRDTRLLEEILQTASERADTELAGEPSVHAAIKTTIGTTYMSLGKYDEAQPHLRNALEILRATDTSDDVDVAISLANLGELAAHRAKYDEAREWFGEALSIYRKNPTTKRDLIATATNNLAYLDRRQGNKGAAAERYREALALWRSIHGDEHPEVATTMNNLANALHDLGELDEAERLYRESLRMRRRVLGDDHPKLTSSLNNLAMLLQDKGDLAAAEPLYRESLSLRRKMYGDKHPRYATALNNLGRMLSEKGDLQEAEPLLRDALSLRLELLGDNHPRVASARYNLGLLLQKMDDLEGAEQLVRAAAQGERQSLGADHPELAATLVALGGILEARNNQSDAVACYQEALMIRRGHFGSEHRLVARTLHALGRLQYSSGALAAAESSSQEAAKIWRAAGLDKRNFLAKSLYLLARVHASQGQAEVALEECSEAHRIQVELFGAADSRSEETQRLLQTLRSSQVGKNVPTP